MKRKAQIITSVAIVSLMAGTALAQQTPAPKPSADKTDSDNTARNARDRDNQTKTPFDQGNSAADVDMTKRIREKIVAEKGVSVNARNVKVITNQGRVTLRGPVNTTQEKSLIGEIAAQIARAENVNNQLEVKQRTSNPN
jgi:hyperosmotically inducible protein